MYEQLAVENLFNLAQTEAEPLLQSVAYPWEALPKIGSFLQALGPTPVSYTHLDVYKRQSQDCACWCTE